MNAINHVSSLKQCFEKLAAMTKSGGSIIITIDAHNHGFFKHLFRWVPGDILHPHQYDLKEYRQMLIEENCEIEKEVKLKKAFFFDHYVLVAKKRA
jgi:2-polyprenyl-6-hydroxyphenyl methylase/3-demethylubiquinone-9 3-methyltransferase